jgi:hypothetical protein
MFADGQGFHATVKCQYAFRLGMLANFIAMAVAAQLYVGWASLFGFAALVALVSYITQTTSGLMFSKASIVQYWRSEPNPNDPYDLALPCEAFRLAAQLGRILDDGHHVGRVHHSSDAGATTQDIRVHGREGSSRRFKGGKQ